jgi:TetR/AcrR family transcriptional repressor of nem operon
MPKSNTRESILEIGMELICGRGYNGFSYQHIADQLNVKKAAIHYHFPAKEDLALAVVELQRDKVYSALRFVDDDTAVDVFERLLDLYQSYDLAHGLCTPDSALAAEAVAIAAPINAACRAFTMDLISWIENFLDKGAKAGTLKFAGSSDGHALNILTSLIGAQLLTFSSGIDVMSKTADKLRSEFVVA